MKHKATISPEARLLAQLVRHLDGLLEAGNACSDACYGLGKRKLTARWDNAYKRISKVLPGPL